MAHSLAAVASGSFSPSAVRRRLSSQFFGPFRATNVLSSRSFASIPSRTSPLRFTICCAAKKETVETVCKIVKTQLALPDGTDVTAESKFSELGADSLDTVEIVMGLEEQFNITVDETSAQDIATVQDAADLIEKLVLEKTA